jgi:hypothetical protein
MAAPSVERRTYRTTYHRLYGICLTALGQMRARIVRQDIERGEIVATVGAGMLAPLSELALTLAPVDGDQSSLYVAWRALRWGGNRTILRVFLESVDTLEHVGRRDTIA